MKDIGGQVRKLKGFAEGYAKCGNWHVADTFKEAADTIQSLCLEQQTDSKDEDSRIENGWVRCDEWMPSTVEYMEFEPTPHMKRIEIAYMTDTVEYLIGYYDGSKWLDKHHGIIKNVIAWRKFLPLPGKSHES